MRRIGIVLGMILLGLLVFGGYYWYKDRKAASRLEVTQDELTDMDEAKKLLVDKKPKEALALIKKNRKSIENGRKTSPEWIQLFIQASTETVDLPQLVILYEHSPNAFNDDEKASILIGDAMILSGKGNDYRTLREKWKGREALPQSWLVLDADALLLENKRKEAIDLLKSQSFEGSKDTGRLVRLALLYVLEQPKTAWDYLTEAYKKDPESPDVRSYRAKLLESIGKPGLALSEYRAAIGAMPKSLFLKDQLAEFYIRNKQFNEAIKIWVESISMPFSDPVWVKALFWSKVSVPTEYEWAKQTVPDGNLKPLIEYYMSLKPDEYWNQNKFSAIQGGQKFLKTQQSTFWLRVLSALKRNDDKEASDLLNSNIFTNPSWNPNLETALKQTINYRKTGIMTVDSLTPLQVESKSNEKTDKTKSESQPALGKHPFFATLNELSKKATLEPSNAKVPEDYHKLMTGPLSYSVSFLAAGWYRAALDLMKTKDIPEDYPEWVVTNYIGAYREVFGNDAALDFAKKQKQTPAVQLIIGELYIANKNLEEGVKQLLPLLKENETVASTAAYFIVLSYMDQKEFKKAKKLIQENPTLFKEVTMKELLARIAIVENNLTEAATLYSSIEKQSAEARSFLAKKAFEDKDWVKAKAYTEQLLKDYPENPVLRDNLERINQEEKKLKENS